MSRSSTFLVFGATGGTGKQFVSLALEEGHNVRVLVRDAAKLAVQHTNLHVQQGSITDVVNLDGLVRGTDSVISMLGDRIVQQKAKINTAFVKKLIPTMQRTGVKRFLYQAGGLSTPYKGHLSPLFWAIRQTLARGFDGQHKDNEAVMEYLVEEAQDIEWMVHRAGIGSNGPSKGVLSRSASKFSIATFRDCATYNFRTLADSSAIHTCDLSFYAAQQAMRVDGAEGTTRASAPTIERVRTAPRHAHLGPGRMRGGSTGYGLRTARVPRPW